MKKVIITIVAIIMTIFANSAKADEVSVALYVRDIPGATVNDARECSRAWAHGGYYMAKIGNVKLECAKHLITETFDYE